MLKEKNKRFTRANWMAEFERLCYESNIYPRGKVDWVTAQHLYNKNLTFNQAVKAIK